LGRGRGGGRIGGGKPNVKVKVEGYKTGKKKPPDFSGGLV
jgi:hypothetical protein